MNLGDTSFKSIISKPPYVISSSANVYHSPSSANPRSGQLFFEAVRFSFAVAKIEQKLNTNQIFTQNISQYRPLSCTHFPVIKRVTGGKKFFRFGKVMGAFVGEEGGV